MADATNCTRRWFSYPWIAYCTTDAAAPGEPWTALSNEALECAAQGGRALIVKGRCTGFGSRRCVTAPTDGPEAHELARGTGLCVW